MPTATPESRRTDRWSPVQEPPLSRRISPGPAWMVGASLVFTVMLVLVKLARLELSAVEVIWWRGLGAVPSAWLLARPVGLRLRGRRVFAIRAGLGFLAMSCFFTAARWLAVADLSLVTRTQPLMVAWLAPVALGVGERPGARIWGAMVAGLAGCAVLLVPTLDLEPAGAAAALGAAVFSSGAHVALRALGRTDDPRVVVFWFQLVAAALSLLAIAAWTGAPPPMPPPAMLPVLAGIGLAATVGQVMATRAYQVERAAVVAGATYVGPLWGALADVVVFGTLPGARLLLGGALVVGAGMTLLLGGSPRRGRFRAAPGRDPRRPPDDSRAER